MGPIAALDRIDPEDPPSSHDFEPAGASGSRGIGAGSGGVVPGSLWYGPHLSGGQERQLLAELGAHNGVAVLQWPRDADHLELIAGLGLPRLLLVHPAPGPPPPPTSLQSVLPASAPVAQVHAALVSLCRRATELRSSASLPSMDAHGTLRAGEGRLVLPAAERPLARLMVERFGAPVPDAILAAKHAELSAPSGVALIGRLAHLSWRVNALGLEVAATPVDAHVMRWCAA